ncbi:MAG: Tol-Pal system protein TolB [Burkholderiaceae bacterium]|nr:MAG: Tol-Pal system protein TolB [Burkholderiaceae bacterium]
MTKNFCLTLCGVLLTLLLPHAAQAQLRIEISGVGGKQIPIAIAPFRGETGMPQQISTIVRDDLVGSGLFKAIPTGAEASALTETSQVSFGDWQNRGADALVAGSVTKLADGRFDVRFRLLDTVKQSDLGSLSYAATPALLRFTAHQIADYVYQKLIGEPGIFSTRMAYVAKQGTRYELLVADIDGQNPQPALLSNEPIISPAWSADGRKLAYVSFESRKPVIYVHVIATGKRMPVANFKGSNSAPAWSPDGTQLAVVLSRSGLQQIYLINADGSNLRRLTTSSGIDTNPVFSPDGRYIYFTSDRGGSPQIYRVSPNGGEPERLTFSTDYNVRPAINPGSNTIAYVTRRDGRYQIAIMDLSTHNERVLTDGVNDDSPTFSPNGRFILYESKNNRIDILAMVSIDGTLRKTLPSINAVDTRDPVWGPFFKN